jgi:hypothetical protein
LFPTYQLSRLTDRFALDHYPYNASLLLSLHSLRLPSHIQESELAQRWLNNKFLVKISERGLELLIAWSGGGKSKDANGGTAQSQVQAQAQGSGQNQQQQQQKKKGRYDTRGKVWSFLNERVKFESELDLFFLIHVVD